MNEGVDERAKRSYGCMWVVGWVGGICVCTVEQRSAHNRVYFLKMEPPVWLGTQDTILSLCREHKVVSSSSSFVCLRLV